MVEWVIALGAASLLFFVAMVVLLSRCISMGAEITRLESKNAVLKESLFTMRVALESELRKETSNQYDQQIASLKLALHLKQEKIDELQTKLKELRTLLRQKWDGSKKHF